MVVPRSGSSSSPEHELGTVVASLRQRSGSALPDDDLQTAAQRGLDRFSDARIRDFVPLLVERQVRDELRTLAAHGPARNPAS